MLHGIVGQVCRLLFPTFLYDTAINLLCAKLRAKKKKTWGEEVVDCGERQMEKTKRESHEFYSEPKAMSS